MTEKDKRERQIDGSQASDPASRRVSRAKFLAGAAGLGAAASVPLWATDVAGAAAERARAAAGTKPLIIWASHFFTGQPQAEATAVGFQDFAGLAGWDFKVTAPVSPSDDVTATVATQQQALALKPFCIVCTMIDPTAFNKNFEAIQAAGVLLLLNNSQPQAGNARPWSYHGLEAAQIPFVGSDLYGAALDSTTTLLADVVSRGHKSGVIIFGGCCDLSDGVGERVAGMKAALAAFNKAHGTTFTYDLFQDMSDTDPTQSLGIWEAHLRAHGSPSTIRGITQTNIGASCITAMQKLGYKANEIPVYYFDTTAQREAYVQSDWIQAIVDQQPYVQGYVSAAHAWMIINRYAEPPAFYDSGQLVVTKANVAAAIKRDKIIFGEAAKYNFLA